MVTVRTVIGVAASHTWPSLQMDVHDAFLQGNLTKEVFMDLHQGFKRQGENKVCKLLKSLYGLKQASRQWNLKLTKALLEAGFTQSACDHSFFTKKNGTKIAIVLIYLDDLRITGNNSKLIEEVKTALHNNFNMKDLRDLKFFLGIEVLRSKKGILLTKRKYALELISESSLSGAKPVATPLETNVKLTTVEYNEYTGSTDDHIFKDVNAYQRLIGRLIYLTTTRPDISFTVQMLSQFMRKPKISH